MTVPFLYPIHAARGPHAEQVLAALRSAGVAVWPVSGAPNVGVAQAAAVLLLAGDRPGDHFLQLAAADDAKRPVRAAVFDDAGARLVGALQLWDRAFDFRTAPEAANALLRQWLERVSVIETSTGSGAPPPPAPARVFISYPNRDRAFVDQLAAHLRMCGWEPFFYLGSERDYGAPSVRAELNARILESAGMLVCLSEEWLASVWSQDEEYQARLLPKPIVYLRVRAFAPYYAISSKLAIDVSGELTEWFPTVLRAIEPWRTKSVPACDGH